MTAKLPKPPESMTLYLEDGFWQRCSTKNCRAAVPHIVYIRETPLTKAAGEMLEALEFAELALTDWAHTYAEDQCPDAAGLSWSRIEHRGGALAYIAEALGVVRAAITKGQQQEVRGA